MKYLIIENKEKADDPLLHDIADFLWNNGNYVFIRRINDTPKPQFDINDCDCIVFLNYKEYMKLNSFDGMLVNNLGQYAEETALNNKAILVFAQDGVYSNVIVFPHKVFHFNTLDHIELSNFFSWCKKFNLLNSQP